MALNQKINCTNLAKLLDVTPRTIRNWASDPVNPLPGKRVNGVWLFDCEAVEKWLDQKESTIDTYAMVEDILNSI